MIKKQITTSNLKLKSSLQNKLDDHMKEVKATLAEIVANQTGKRSQQEEEAQVQLLRIAS